MKRVLFAMALVGLMIQPALAVDVAGINLSESVKIGGQKLQLNGYGIRKKYFFKIYVGSLYTAQKATAAAQVVDDNGGKLIRMNFLYSKIEKEKIVGGFAKGIDKNASQLRSDPAVDRFLGWFDADFIEGDQVDLQMAADGTVSAIHNGRTLGSIQSSNLVKALLLIYLGDDPADDDMKDGMLGDI